MSKELVISANRHETKVAILEEDQLVEIYFQRANEYSLAGSIHKGRVTRVLPGMQSAFVDLGLERDTFLYVSDFFEENEEYDRIVPGKEERASRPERSDRGERSERSDKVDFESIVDRAAIEADPVMPEVEGAAEVVESRTGPVLAPPPVSTERSQSNEDRDQRGRRSRRRRNRGRGFPDSKYANSDTGEPQQTSHASEAEPLHEAVELSAPVRSVVEGGDFEFSVLPGESLAKYRRPSGGGREHPVEPEVRDEAPVILSAGSGAALAVEQEPEELEQISESAAAAEERAEMAAQGEAASAIIAEEREGGRFTPEEVVDSPQPGVELIETDEALTLVSGNEPESSADLLQTDEPAEMEGPGEHAGSSAVSEQPQSASVREQGGRYMHRMPRRMRRKMRGGGGGAPQAEASAGAAPATSPAGGRPEVVRPEGQRGEPQRGGRGERNDRPERSERPERTERPERAERPERTPSPLITELLKEGQEILVQIAKEPLGQKGARITSHIALPGRYVVYMPTLEHMGVSRKIASDEERLRLKKILQAHRAGIQGGYIVRTAGEGKTEEEIASDMNFLSNLWLDIRQKAEKKPAPLLLHHDLDIVQRILRDQITESFKSIWVDNEEAYESILRFVQRFQPALVSRVKLYTRSGPIFDAFNITQELEKALRPKVWLKSGGYIVINQTEALVAIDVNTGKYVGKSNRLEDTIVKTNTEAVKEIVRQIRLRDLGGIIVVDFIDMDERKNRQKVMQVLEEAMRSDKAPYKILQFNDFGLVAITRKRVKQSLERALCSPCPYCEGAGSVKSVQTTVGDILQEAHKLARAVEGENVVLRVHPEVGKFLKSNQNKYLEELEEVLRCPVLVKSDPLLHQEKFDLA